MAIIGQSLLNDPADRLSASRSIRGLEDGTMTRDDEERLSRIAETRLKDEVGDDLVQQIGSELVEEKVEEGIPFIGAAVGLLLDTAFIGDVEKAAQFTFQERWLREHGKLNEITPAAAPNDDKGTIVTGVSRAVYTTGYAVGFGVVFPVALIGGAVATVLPTAATDGLKEGAATATSDVDRLIAGVRGHPDPAQRPT